MAAQDRLTIKRIEPTRPKELMNSSFEISNSFKKYFKNMPDIKSKTGTTNLFKYFILNNL
jgi:hypothetical protein